MLVLSFNVDSEAGHLGDAVGIGHDQHNIVAAADVVLGGGSFSSHSLPSPKLQ